MRIEWDGGTLTKKRAAFLCWKMWAWIVDKITQKMWDECSIGPGYEAHKIKSMWPEWESNGGKVYKVGTHCFACQYDAEEMCDNCFLTSLWPDGCSKGAWGDFIIEPDIDKKREHARIIADAAKKVYEGC